MTTWLRLLVLLAPVAVAQVGATHPGSLVALRLSAQTRDAPRENAGRGGGWTGSPTGGSDSRSTAP